MEPHPTSFDMRLAALEEQLARARRRERRVLLAAVLAVAVGTTVALAAPANPFACVRGDLYCFAGDAPARADEVNSNFEAVYRQAARAGLTGGRFTYDGTDVRVQNANAANTAGLATDSQAVNGLKIFLKPGNNGTVSCHTFCTSASFGGGTGPCVGGGCFHVAGNQGLDMNCLCLRP